MNNNLINLGLGSVHVEHISKKNSLSSYYGPTFGIPLLRKIIAKIEDVDIDCVIITTGASMALTSTISNLKRPGNILIPRPYYPSYLGMIKKLGFDYDFYPVMWGRVLSSQTYINTELIEQKIHNNTRAILVNSPGNPFGNIITKQNFTDLIKLANKYDIILVIDEAYADFVYEKSSVNWKGLGILPKVVRIKSFSKTYRLPGERIGYLIAEPSLAQEIGKTHWLLGMSPAIPSQIHVSQTICNYDRKEFGNLLNKLKHNRDIMFEKINNCKNAKIKLPQGGIFHWIEIHSEKLNNSNICQYFQEKANVIVTSGHLFGNEPSLAIRCSFGISNSQISKASEQIVVAINSLD